MKIIKLELIVFDTNINIILCFCLKILRFYYSLICFTNTNDKISEIHFNESAAI